jgi:hypothetical protein
VAACPCTGRIGPTFLEGHHPERECRGKSDHLFEVAIEAGEKRVTRYARLFFFESLLDSTHEETPGFYA